MPHPLDARERAQVCLRFDELGPDAPTLCEGWTTFDLAAHLVVRERNPAEVQRILDMLLACPPQGYVGCCAAIRDADFRAQLERISAPTLVIGGSRDPATPPALAEELASNIPGAALVMIDAAHLSANEKPDVFNAALTDFLA